MLLIDCCRLCVQTLDDALLTGSFSLSAANGRLSLSSNSSGDYEGSPEALTRPPLGSSKRRKSSPMSECSVDIRATPSSSAAALLSLNPALKNKDTLVPGTPSTIVHLPLRVESTPYAIRSASPNSLSIAKALKLLGASATLAQALDLANSLDSCNMQFEIKELKTPHSDTPSSQAQSSNGKDSISSAEMNLNSSTEITDSECDGHLLRKLDYEEKIHINVFPTGSQ